ncbi:MAG: AMIN domain-containing protein [Epsilonproteobacteria bacterium]|nr:AMIN domain-containing protein [Campylobacterota bacterium]
MRLISLFLLFSILAIARENPFVSIENITKATQINKRDTYFEDLKFKLPSSARILKSIEVSYQNLNGSINKKTITINKKIDWHDELFFTKKIMNQQKQVLKIEKRETREIGKIYKFKDFIKFEVKNKSIKIITKDVKIRDFLVSKPYKIVFDFRRDASFLTKLFKVDMPPFVSIVLGNHDKYYRVAIKLDGQYTYKLRRAEGNFIITLN